MMQRHRILNGTIGWAFIIDHPLPHSSHSPPCRFTLLRATLDLLPNRYCTGRQGLREGRGEVPAFQAPVVSPVADASR